MFQETMEAMRIMGIPEEEQMGTELGLLWLRRGGGGLLITHPWRRWEAWGELPIGSESEGVL